MFSCEFCEISKNTFFYRTPPVAASVSWERSQEDMLKHVSEYHKSSKKDT